MKLATAFNRVHPNNMEGGIVNEEFLVEYAVDRVSTVGQAFMGLTVACARCHDHKYDPISQKNFYEMTSYFNNINESGQISWNNAMPVPTLLLTSDEEEKMLSYLERLIQDSEAKIYKLKEDDLTNHFTKWISNKSYKKAFKSGYLDGLVTHYKLDNEHIKDVKNTPLDYLNDYISVFPQGKDFFIHCAGGYRSVIAASILKAKGFNNVIDVVTVKI